MIDLSGRAEVELESPVDFEEFYRAHHTQLFRALVVATGSAQEAEDVLQEAFIRVWKRWDSISRVENIPGYLHRTAIRVYLSKRRRLARRTSRVWVESRQAGNPFEGVETHDVLWAAVNHLPPRQRAALVLVELLGYDSKGASRILGIQEGTTRTLVSRARASVRRDVEASWRETDEIA